MESRKRILVTGAGSGQLGGFLSIALAKDHSVSYTYRRDAPEEEWEELQALGAKKFQLELANDESNLPALVQCLKETRPEMVINCAAIARPKFCEDHPEVARSINIPTLLVRAMKEADVSPLLMHISTDLVYAGDSAELYSETSPTDAINIYGKSKVEAEKYLAENYPNFVALRSSMIYGPVPPNRSSSFFTSFVDSALSSGKPTDFFYDEFRSPIFIDDFRAVAFALIKNCVIPNTSVREAGLSNIYNFGGPQRLSRVEMATKICDFRKHDQNCIISSSTKTIDRGVPSPMDTSMDSSLISKELNITLTDFDTGMKLSFP